jgi:aspartate racemase
MVGVVGGMGPLASAEFLKTIYEAAATAVEQDAPRVILYSDPSMPDRTEAILTGRDEALAARLIDVLRWLESQQVTTVVICCVTIHYLVPRLPASLRARVISLVDVILEQVVQQRRRYLLLCTDGTRASGVFEAHPLWARARPWIVMPAAGDQREVHDLIYRLKRNRPLHETRPCLDALLPRYEVDGFIAGCTELHMLAKRMRERGGHLRWECLDPLAAIARTVARLPQPFVSEVTCADSSHSH